MLHSFNHLRTFTHVAAAMLLCATIVHPRHAIATEVVPLTVTETIRQAQTVVVGNVVEQKTRWGTDAERWMLTDYTIAVEEVVFADEGTQPIDETIVVTYWGGTLDGETQAVSDTRLPATGERLLLMLKPGWQTEVSFSPVVGLNYGFFTVAADQPGGPAIVRDAHGAPVSLREDGRMAWTPRAEASTAGTVEIGTFVSWLRANATTIKAEHSKLQPQADHNDPRVLKVFANTPYTPEPADRSAAAHEVGTVPASEGPAQIPFRPNALPGTASGHQHGADDMVPNYSFPRVANLPITVNNFRSTFTPWSPEDQYQLSKWNFYGDIFRVSTNPTGGWAWRDGRFDLCGFPSSADMQSQFGAPWDANTIGICYTTWNSSNVIVESDIALNPAFSFTLNDEWVYDGASARSFRQVLLHELGHMWGLAHQTNFLSIMNDSQSVFRFHAFPYMDDAEAIRAAYPSASVGRADLGVYLRYSNGTQSIVDMIFASSVTAGSDLTFSNYHIENLGTTTITTPTVEWYLTSVRNFSGTYHSLGTTTYGSLNRFQYIGLADTARTLTVPANVPAGAYYLAAFIRNDSSPSQASFPFSNDFAFSRSKIQVNTPPVLIGAVSRKEHGTVGTFDVALPLTGPVGTEPRRSNPAGTHQIILTFSEAVSIGGAAVTAGTGRVSSYSVNGSTVIVNLTDLSNMQVITLRLTNVSNGAASIDASVSMGVLFGDVNATGAVNSGDALATRTRSGETAAPTNFTHDVNCDGTINGGDAFTVRARSGDAINP